MSDTTLKSATDGALSKASEVGRKAGAFVDANRHSAAESIDRVATSLRRRANNLPGGEKATSVAHGAARTLNYTAEYLRSHKSRRMTTDFQSLVKSHATQSLVAAAVIGFLTGRALTSRD